MERVPDCFDGEKSISNWSKTPWAESVVFHSRCTIVSRLIFSTQPFRTFPCNETMCALAALRRDSHTCVRGSLITIRLVNGKFHYFSFAKLCVHDAWEDAHVINPPFLSPPLPRPLSTANNTTTAIINSTLRGSGTSKANGTYEDRLRSEPCLFTSMRNRANEIRRFFRKSVGRPTIKRPQ